MLSFVICEKDYSAKLSAYLRRLDRVLKLFLQQVYM